MGNNIKVPRGFDIGGWWMKQYQMTQIYSNRKEREKIKTNLRLPILNMRNITAKVITISIYRSSRRNLQQPEKKLEGIPVKNELLLSDKNGNIGECTCSNFSVGVASHARCTTNGMCAKNSTCSMEQSCSRSWVPELTPAGFYVFLRIRIRSRSHECA